jgi:hypothetical protein
VSSNKTKENKVRKPFGHVGLGTILEGTNRRGRGNASGESRDDTMHTHIYIYIWTLHTMEKRTLIKAMEWRMPQKHDQ